MIPAKPSSPSDAALTLEILGVAAGRELRVGAERPTILVPIESAVVLVTVGDERLTADRSAFAVVPEGEVARIAPSAAVASVAVIGVGPAAVERMVLEYRACGADATKLATWWSRPTLLPRTVWVHEIVHRYVFERHALEQHASEAARFLEVEIVKEIFFLFRDRDEGSDRATMQQRHSATVERAVAFVEAHLLEEIAVGELVRAAGTSESALLRAFRREVGLTPAAYWRRRKLDAALDLLRSGQHSVAEVAERVGYETATAFGEAFARRFGRPPSSFKPSARVKPAP